MRFFSHKRSILPIIVAVFSTVFSACNSNESKQQVQTSPASAKPVLTQPFRYHKTIEVSPGNTFDIFSWGRGSTEIGSLLILESDSSAMKYTTTTGDLDGAITDVYNTDMDMDGNPEILVQAKSKDSTIYTQIYAFEYRDNKAQKLDFPKLTSSQKKGYRGEDNFYIKEGVLMREFPIYDGNSADAKPTGEKRLLQYGLRSNSFTVKTITDENDGAKTASATDTVKQTAVATTVPATKPVVKKASQKKHIVTKSTPKKSRKSSTKSKKSRKRHR